MICDGAQDPTKDTPQADDGQQPSANSVSRPLTSTASCLRQRRKCLPEGDHSNVDSFEACRRPQPRTGFAFAGSTSVSPATLPWVGLAFGEPHAGVEIARSSPPIAWLETSVPMEPVHVESQTVLQGPSILASRTARSEAAHRHAPDFPKSFGKPGLIRSK